MEEHKERAYSLDSELSYEIIEVANCTDRLKGLLARIFVSVIVIGACSGALIWSFEKGEAGVYNGTIRNTSTEFNIFIDEYSLRDGTYSVQFRVPDSINNTLEVLISIKSIKFMFFFPDPQTFPSFWVQDDKNKRLVHRKDNETTVFCYPTHTYWVRYNKYGDVIHCRDDRTVSYKTYIDRLGLANLTREHSAFQSTHNHAKVFIYNGDPTDVILEKTKQTAFLVTAYSDAYSGALLGWDTYFISSNISRMYQISYSYDTMTPKTPDYSAFDPPVECEPN